MVEGVRDVRGFNTEGLISMQKEGKIVSDKKKVRTIRVTTKDNPGLKKIMDQLSEELFKKNYDLYKRLAMK